MVSTVTHIPRMQGRPAHHRGVVRDPLQMIRSRKYTSLRTHGCRICRSGRPVVARGRGTRANLGQPRGSAGDSLHSSAVARNARTLVGVATTKHLDHVAASGLKSQATT